MKSLRKGRDSALDMGIGKNFVNGTPVVQETMPRMDQQDLEKLNTLHGKGNSGYTSYRELIFRIDLKRN